MPIDKLKLKWRSSNKQVCTAADLLLVHLETLFLRLTAVIPGSSVSTVTVLRAAWPLFDSWQGQGLCPFATPSSIDSEA
jgi:hypothetical protein